jgi:hypothetical protein
MRHEWSFVIFWFLKDIMHLNTAWASLVRLVFFTGVSWGYMSEERLAYIFVFPLSSWTCTQTEKRLGISFFSVFGIRFQTNDYIDIAAGAIAGNMVSITVW